MICFFILMSFLSVAYLLHFNQVYNNPDFIYHYSRINGIKYNLIKGNYPFINQGTTVPYGTVLSFYPWLTLLPFILLSFFIPNGVILFYSVIGIILFITYMTSYFGSKVINNSNSNAFVYSILYTNSSLIFNWAFYSGDIGATLAMAFFPLAFFGLISFLKDGKHIIMFTIGILLALSSHLITGGIGSLFLLIIGIFYINKINYKKSLKLFASLMTIILLTSIFWYPMFELSHLNNINLPSNFGHILDGIYEYIGKPANYVYGITEIIGFASILFIKSKNYTKLDLISWFIGIICFVINIKYIGNFLSTYTPFISKFQFAFRFMLVAHIFLAFLATKLITGKYNDAISFPKSFEYIFVAFCICIPFVNEYGFQFLMHNRYLVDTVSKMYYAESKSNDTYYNKFKFNAASYKNLQHFYYAYDYAPNPIVKNNLHLDMHFKTKIYDKNDNQNHIINYQPTKQGIIINNKGYQNIEYPIYIYKGIKYKFTLNHHRLSDSHINEKLTYNNYRLTLKNLPKGKNMISIASANLEK